MSVNTLAVEAVARTGALAKAPSRDDSVAALTKYIPTESLTLYIATVSSHKALVAVVPWFTAQLAYTLFIILTPLLMLILFFRKLALADQDWRVGPGSWPWWRMVASTVAFAVWAMAVPGNPMIDADNAQGGIVAGLAALFISTILNLFAPLFEREPPRAMGV